MVSNGEHTLILNCHGRSAMVIFTQNLTKPDQMDQSEFMNQMNQII